VHLDSSAEAEVTLRTRRLTNGLYLVALLGALAWTFGGFFVNAEIRNGTLDTLGTVIWAVIWWGPLIVFVPLVRIFPLALIEPRGIFRWFYAEPTVVHLTHDELSWTMPNGVTGQAAWNDVGGVSTYGDAGGNSTQLFDLTGVEIAEFEGGFIDSTRKAVDLSAVVLELRADLFEFVAEPSIAMRGCIRRHGRRIGLVPAYSRR
jgi:hypothetical protein